ncbi:MAG TPA: hypothetical protein PLK27_09205, partial [Neisseria sp.]|nr:hypothetical protein [Neisseria sp.]
MSIPLWRSRTGLRYYLFHGIALSLLLVALALGACVWSVYSTGNRPLAADARADAAVFCGIAQEIDQFLHLLLGLVT